MLLLALKIIALVLVTVLVLLLVRTNQLLWTQDQTSFTHALETDTLPNGTYAGTVTGPKVSWLGKKFNAATHSGINLFSTASGTFIEKYPFTLSIGPGVHDNRLVVQIEYNSLTNPLWLRPVLDEIVEVAPGEYLGKLQVRLIPGYPFTITYFRLSKKL